MSIHRSADQTHREAERHAIAIAKQPTVERTSKLLSAARDYPCVLCHKHGYTVAAHCNDSLFKGIGRKAPDWMVAYVCGDPGGCHDQIDGRAGGLSKDAKRAMWDRAYKLTVNIWFSRGWVRVA